VPRNDPRIFNGTGQLVAVVADAQRPDNADEIAISRPGVLFDDVETGLDGPQDPATRYVYANGTEHTINLAIIGDRMRAAGLA
jgi:hypothetical protein